MADAPVTREPAASRRPSSRRLRRLCQLWVTGAAAAVAVTAASALGWLEPLQVRTLDLVQRLGGQRFPPEVVVVAIDEAAFEKLGARQPIPRGYLASVLRGLDRSGAAAIGLDIALSVPTTAADDEALARAIRQFGGDERGDRPRLVLVLEIAEKALRAAQARARELNTTMTVTVVDESGRLVLCARGNGAGFFTTETSRGKAVAAANFRRPTKEMVELAREHPVFWNALPGMVPGEVLVSTGGMPISSGGRVIGAIGCGGGTGEQDHQCALAGGAAV